MQYGTNTFDKRDKLTKLISDEVKNLFNSDEVDIIPFGVENIPNTSLHNFISSPMVNSSMEGMMLKFLPDYILVKKTPPRAIYFLEIKSSVTPLWARSNFEQIKQRQSNIKLSDVGVVAREAWSAYKNFFQVQ